MSVLVFGKTGQVACELQRLHPEFTYLSREEADLAQPEICAEAILKAKPGAVINAAAYTAVDRAEEEEVLTHTINAEAPAAMARACATLGIPLIHISTDYVFDGSGNHVFKPNNTPNPINAYGRTKLAGEEAIRASGALHAILRTSWVFSAHGNNFVKTMLRLSETGNALSIVSDQIGGPTPASAIATACVRISEIITKSGTYHLSGAPETSWADFAREIFAQAGRKVTITDIETVDYPTPAKRPLNSRLDCASLLSDFGVNQPAWKDALNNVIRELT
ncbi:dTDP-4-dehydrorhamnose reductase [Lentibacter sp. XHP0401]|jgi:dTDP-4-dehydrorhamnose reductase|uniref:dTDP-4-dehydrorhamnose reductase n=1 Tax=Lentibacter sp. XHP0401 TaxID=2984334 RepID=UPI0021E7AE9A|nr:dTDP-4-dehydrorhamnose reductase [Lentibacter sp. XHP0401]MCV2892609.1 dTDP-4-dehydrorhamnose reductase [Lentibacter sp. XHP0401]